MHSKFVWLNLIWPDICLFLARKCLVTGHCHKPWHHHVGIVHRIIIESINKNAYALYKTFKQGLFCLQLLSSCLHLRWGSHYDTHSPVNNEYQGWKMIFCWCGCNKYAHCPWFEEFGRLYFAYYASAGFSGGKAWVEKLHSCNCLCVVLHIMWYMHTLFVCYSRISCEISQVTCMRISSLSWAAPYV